MERFLPTYYSHFSFKPTYTFCFLPTVLLCLCFLELRPSCSCNTTQTRATLHGSTHNGGARGNIHNDDLTSTFLELTDPSLCTWGAARSIIPSLKLTGLRKCEPRGFSDHCGRDEADCPGLHSPDQLETDAPESPGRSLNGFI